MKFYGCLVAAMLVTTTAVGQEYERNMALQKQAVAPGWLAAARAAHADAEQAVDLLELMVDLLEDEAVACAPAPQEVWDAIDLLRVSIDALRGDLAVEDDNINGWPPNPAAPPSTYSGFAAWTLANQEIFWGDTYRNTLIYPLWVGYSDPVKAKAHYVAAAQLFNNAIGKWNAAELACRDIEDTALNLAALAQDAFDLLDCGPERDPGPVPSPEPEPGPLPEPGPGPSEHPQP